MTLVTFNVDQYPYCKGDTVDLDKDQLEAVKAESERRGVKDTYTTGEAAPSEDVSAPDVRADFAAQERVQAEFNAQAKAEREEREAIRAESDAGVATEDAVEAPLVVEPTLKAKQSKASK
jgi:hypothetical protein